MIFISDCALKLSNVSSVLVLYMRILVLPLFCVEADEEDDFKLALHICHFVVFGDVLQLGRQYRVDDDCKKAKVQMRGV